MNTHKTIPRPTFERTPLTIRYGVYLGSTRYKNMTMKRTRIYEWVKRSHINIFVSTICSTPAIRLRTPRTVH